MKGRQNRAFILPAVLFLLVLFFLLWSRTTLSQEQSPDAYTPITNEGKKWRIGYVETEPYANYAGTFYSLVMGLGKDGWLANVDELPFQSGQTDTKRMWQWLSQRDTGNFIEFVDDGHYSLKDGTAVQEALARRLTLQKDLDLLIAMGTGAGVFLSQLDYEIPTMIFSSTNAVQSGIVRSENDSGAEHLWAHIDPGLYRRQVEVFYDLFHFKKLGVVYPHNPVARVFSAIDDVQAVASERGFQVVEYDIVEPRDGTDDELERYYLDLTQAFTALAKEVDAVYLTYGAWRLRDLPHLLTPLYEGKIPVFSQQGADEVAHGALLSLAPVDFAGIGQFGAQNMAKVFYDIPPRRLQQVFVHTPNIAINVEAAKKIDYKVPFELLLLADKIYTEIAGEK